MTKLGLLLIVVSVACKSKQPPPPAGDRAGSAVAGAEGSVAGKPGEPEGAASDEASGHNMTGTRPHQGANCPASIPGTTTQIATTARGVDVTVTSKDPKVARRVVALSELHVRGRTAEVSRPHDQKHGGSGWVGYCPIVVTDQTTVTMTPMPDGATLHIDARSPSEVTLLQETIRARAMKLPGYPSS